MKPKIAHLIMAMVIIIGIVAGNTAYAESTSQTIYLTITVVGRVSLNIDEDALFADSGTPKAEAFSELKQHDIAISRLARNNSDVWIFTKTE